MSEHHIKSEPKHHTELIPKPVGGFEPKFRINPGPKNVIDHHHAELNIESVPKDVSEFEPKLSIDAKKEHVGEFPSELHVEFPLKNVGRFISEDHIMSELNDVGELLSEHHIGRKHLNLMGVVPSEC